MKARIFNIQKYSIYDGPGIRTLVFFQGCPLNCLWCSNPEGKRAAPRLVWRAALCRHCGRCAAVCPNGVHGMAGEPRRRVFAGGICAGCGRCAQECPADALEICGKEMEIEEIMRAVLEDKVFYDVSSGGLTLGGGEPLAQPEAAVALLGQAKAHGLNTAVETCGHARTQTLWKIAPLVDLFLYDLKHLHGARHKELTGVDNDLILGNLEWLMNEGRNVRLRMPLINGCNADLQEMENRAAYLGQWRARDNFKGVDLLPYHKLGVHKYGQLGENYGLGAPASVTPEFLLEAEKIFARSGLPVAVVRH